MQTAEHRTTLEAADALNGACDWGVLSQRKMGAGSVVIFQVAGQHTTQVSLSEHYDVVEALPSYRPDQTLRITVLPG
jgi:hypothetical protein